MNITKEKYEIGNIVFDKKEAELTNTKACLYLNNKECEVMEILVNNQERNVSKKEIKQKVWSNEKKNENIVTMYITYLQEKFLALGANIRINENNGYVLESI